MKIKMTSPTQNLSQICSLENTVWKNILWENTFWGDSPWENTFWGDAPWENTLWKN